MKKDIHPKDYRPVVFKDMSNGDMFLSRSTAKTNDTVEFEGETYPVIKVEISNTSHPFYTGKSKLVDTAGRVDKFMSRYGKAQKKSLKQETNAHLGICLLFLYSLLCTCEPEQEQPNNLVKHFRKTIQDL